MIAFAAVAVLVVVVVGVGWARLSSARAERRSLQSYEKTLDLLGDVAKRSDASADVHVPTGSELARPHVRPAPDQGFPPPARSAVRILPPARVRLEPPVLPGMPAAKLPVFGEVAPAGDPPTEVSAPAGDPPTEVFTPAGDPPTEVFAAVPAGGQGVAVFDFDDTAGQGAPVVPAGRMEMVRAARAGGDRKVRRAATGAAAAVAVGAIAVGGWQLASHKASTAPVVGQPAPASASTPLARSKSHVRTHAKAGTPTTSAVPAAFQPTSTSSSIVTYQAPAGAYTVTFKATSGACWLGAQQQANSSKYLQMWTLAPGQSASYTATGPLVLKIGAPRYVAIEVDGKPVVLPGYVNPYDVSFTANTGTTA